MYQFVMNIICFTCLCAYVGQRVSPRQYALYFVSMEIVCMFAYAETDKKLFRAGYESCSRVGSWPWSNILTLYENQIVRGHRLLVVSE